MTHRPALLNGALAAAARGWHVFPLTPGTKRPAVRDWENRATIDPDRIRRCWATGPFNIGIACGPSRLLVLDLDVPKHDDETPPAPWNLPGIRDGESVYAELCARTGQPFPFETYTVRTCGGGTHRYFTIPDDLALLASTIGTLGWKVDTRCRGGYVVADGSTVDGSDYRCEVDQPPAPVPASLLISKEDRPRTGPHTTPGQWAHRMNNADAYTRAALTGETDRVRTAPEGQRNATLFRSAAALGRLVAAGTLPRDAAEGALTDAAYAAGLDEPEIRRTLASGLARSANTAPRSAA